MHNIVILRSCGFACFTGRREKRLSGTLELVSQPQSKVGRRSGLSDRSWSCRYLFRILLLSSLRKRLEIGKAALK